MELSLLVGLKNNIAYTKQFYATTRELYPNIEIVFVSYGSNDGTNEWLDVISDDNVKYYYSNESKTLSDTYNKCISLATKKYVALLHNDMVLGNGFLENILKQMSDDRILFYRVIEPPIFAEDKHEWKLIEDFGTDFNTFDNTSFQEYVKKIEKEFIKPTGDLCFFLAVSRMVLMDINGFDPIFNPMFREDDDLLLRLKLLGLKAYQSYEAVVYHFVSKTSRFSEEYVNITKEIEERSDRNFNRKWGFGIQSRFKHKRQIAFIIKNVDEKDLVKLEPYASKIYTVLNIDNYLKHEQGFTNFNLSERIVHVDGEKNEDILIFFDGKRNLADLHLFPNISDEIEIRLSSSTNRIKSKLFSSFSFRISDLRVEVKRLRTYEQNLIIR